MINNDYFSYIITEIGVDPYRNRLGDHVNSWFEERTVTQRSSPALLRTALRDLNPLKLFYKISIKSPKSA